MIAGRILGLDPGLGVTGYAVVDTESGHPRIVEAGVFRGGRKAPLPERLATLHSSMHELIQEQKPSVVAVEDLFSHYDRPRTAILMGHARGVLLLAASQKGLPVVGYLPTAVKKSMTGNGHASKAQMQDAVRLQFGLKGAIEIPDVADALAIAVCHFHSARASAEWR